MKPTGTQTRLRLGRKPLVRPHGFSHSAARGLSGAWATFHHQSHFFGLIGTRVIECIQSGLQFSQKQSPLLTPKTVSSAGELLFTPAAQPGKESWDCFCEETHTGIEEMWGLEKENMNRDLEPRLSDSVGWAPYPNPPFSLIVLEKQRWCRHSSCWWPDRQFPQRYMRPFGVPVRRLAAEWHQWGQASIPSGNAALIDRQRQREGLFLNLKRIPFFSP